MAVKIIVATATAVALALLLLAQPGGPDPAVRTFAVALIAISLWATGLVPIGITALFFFLAAVLVGLPPGEVFSGFQSSAFWLVFGGIIVGVAVQHTGLGDFLVRAIIGRWSPSYMTILWAVALAGLVLNFVMPSSMGRVVLLVPIVVTLAQGFGFGPGSNGRSGMVMTAGLVSFVPAGAVLPALVPGLTLAGASETLYGQTFGYMDYLIINFPVGGACRTILIVLIAGWLFPDLPTRQPDRQTKEPLTSRGYLLGLILIGALVLWSTDHLHGVSPGWVGLAAGLICLLPVLQLVPSNTMGTRLDTNSLLYVAAVLGLGAVFAGSGLSQQIGQTIIDLAVFGRGPFTDFALLTGLSTVSGMVVTNPGVPAILSPLATPLADATGLPLKTVLMSQVLGFSNVVLPYQASPVLVALQLGGVRLAQGAKFTLALSLAGFVTLMPLTYAWWTVLGMFNN